jgi:hypothetical protein
MKDLTFVGDKNILKMWSMSRNDIRNYDHPGVEMHCLRGSELSTPHIIRYDEPDSFPDKPKMDSGFGDGTVPDASGDVCLKWSEDFSNQVTPYQFFSKRMPFVSHVEMIRSPTVVRYVVGNILTYNRQNFMR